MLRRAVGGYKRGSFGQQWLHRRCIHTNVIDTLRARHFVQAVTSEAITKRVETPIAVYCGVDPTASSLHLGNMVTLMGLLHFSLAGHQAIPLVGNATGSIGDPSGRSTERIALDHKELAKNVAGIEAQLIRFFSRGTQYALSRISNLDPSSLKPVRVLHNADWYTGLGVLDFLGTVGRHARVGTMMARDSVKSRLQSVHGISFTEFSYQLLQAYDFWHLYHFHKCHVQIGGSDQWGNITAGTDLIHRMHGPQSDKSEAFGLTIPLLTTASGEKFGKSAGNAIWLDETRTSPFDIYQFFIKTADSDVERFLKMFTLLPLPRIAQVIDEHARAPHTFIAQKLLATEVTELIHGPQGVQQALCATQVLFGNRQTLEEHKFTSDDFDAAFGCDQRMVKVARADVVGKSVADIAVLLGSCKSKSEATRLAKGGGLYWNGSVVVDSKWVPSVENGDFVGDGTVGVVRTGKTNYRLLKLLDS